MRTSQYRAFGDALRAMRRCLGGCSELFLSDGPWHRTCPACELRNRKLSRRETSRGVAARHDEVEGAGEDSPIFDATPPAD